MIKSTSSPSLSFAKWQLCARNDDCVPTGADERGRETVKVWAGGWFCKTHSGALYIRMRHRHRQRRQFRNFRVDTFRCTVNRTFHRANPSTLKHFIRQFFSFPIVSYGVWDGESYKKIEYLFIFVPYLSVLMVREWIYVDVEWIYVDVDRPRFQEKN